MFVDKNKMINSKVTEITKKNFYVGSMHVDVAKCKESCRTYIDTSDIVDEGKFEVLVTGCFGTIGIFMVNYLLDKGYTVIGLDNCSSNSLSRIRLLNIIGSKGTFRYYPNAKMAFKFNNIDSVIHLAGYTKARDNNYKKHYESNVMYTEEILNLAIKYKVKKFIFASSSAVYTSNYNEKHFENETFVENRNITDKNSAYALSKLTAENMCINRINNEPDIDLVILRYFNVIAPIQYAYDKRPFPCRCVDNILFNEPLTITNNGNSCRQYVYIDNIVSATYKALLMDRRLEVHDVAHIYNVTVDDEPISTLELYRFIYNYITTVFYDNDINHDLHYAIDITTDKEMGDTDYNIGTNKTARLGLHTSDSYIDETVTTCKDLIIEHGYAHYNKYGNYWRPSTSLINGIVKYINYRLKTIYPDIFIENDFHVYEKDYIITASDFDNMLDNEQVTETTISLFDRIKNKIKFMFKKYYIGPVKYDEKNYGEPVKNKYGKYDFENGYIPDNMFDIAPQPSDMEKLTSLCDENNLILNTDGNGKPIVTDEELNSMKKLLEKNQAMEKSIKKRQNIKVKSNREKEIEKDLFVK